MDCRHCEAKDSVKYTGLNDTGVVVFILLILFCVPLCWIPFVSNGMKKRICSQCGREIL